MLRCVCSDGNDAERLLSLLRRHLGDTVATDGEWDGDVDGEALGCSYHKHADPGSATAGNEFGASSSFSDSISASFQVRRMF